jgi:hypothetical protein
MTTADIAAKLRASNIDNPRTGVLAGLLFHYEIDVVGCLTGHVVYGERAKIISDYMRTSESFYQSHLKATDTWQETRRTEPHLYWDMPIEKLRNLPIEFDECYKTSML